ncbi:MAG TPA: alanine--glyoxylate aminotransferase family protein [Armatimonadota bacterium]|nr:alanine--glyoxylate aminotransferase family protein [Armatimonadota bacterium]
MPRKNLLLIPGPTPVPDDVMRAMTHPMVNHRGPEFVATIEECVEGLRAIFRTSGDVLAFPASGTGGLEAAIVNVLSPGDRVLSCSVGAFGDRFAKIAQSFGARVESCGFQWGDVVDPAVVEARLREDTNHSVQAVLLTHNETSTGVVNDVESVAHVVREHGALLLVDSISGMIAHPIPVDDWGLDVVVAGSQKAFMIPPGLAFISVGPRAWDAHKTASMPRYYWDFASMRDRALTPYTPAVPLFYALQTALRMLLEEGLPAVAARHHLLALALRSGVESLDLALLAPEGRRSSAVTAIRVPPNVTVKALRARLRDPYGLIVAGGQGKLESEIIRIGHLGYTGWTDIVCALAGLEMALNDLGRPVVPGTGVAAAQQVLRTAPAGVSL